MKVFGFFLLACLTIAALQATFKVLLVILAILLAWGVFFRPRETLGFLAFFLLWSAVQNHFLVCAALFGLIAVAKRQENSNKK